MGGLLSGLGRFGLDSLEGMDLYGKPKQEEKEKKVEEKKAAPVVQEQDLLFDKTYRCPVCDKEFKSRTVKAGKARLVGSDSDLRPKYEQ